MGVSLKKLTRSNNNKIVTGVCGGLGEFLIVNPTIIRIAWIIATIFSRGAFLLVYIIYNIIIPSESDFIYYSDDSNQWQDNTSLFIGVGLMIIGIYSFAKFLFPSLTRLIYKLMKLWPILIILLGIYTISN